MQARNSPNAYLVQLDFTGTGYAPPLDLSPTDPLGFVANEAALRGQTVFGALADPPLIATGGGGPSNAGVSDSGIGANPLRGGGVSNASTFGDLAHVGDTAHKLIVTTIVLLLAAGIVLVGVGGLVPKQVLP